MSDFYLHFTLGLPHLYTMLTLYDCTYVLSQHFFLSSSVIGRITLHGFPTATLSEGISFTTTLPAPITTLLPIVTPGITCTPAPNHTLFPTLIGYAYSRPRFLLSKSIGCPDVWNPQFGATNTLSPKAMLMYGKEASNRKQEIDRQHYTIPNQRPKDKHCGKI